MPTVILIVVFLLAVVALVLWLEVRKSRPGLRRPRSRVGQNPSVFVDMDDQPPTEIDFEAGIRANRNPRTSHAD